MRKTWWHIPVAILLIGAGTGVSGCLNRAKAPGTPGGASVQQPPAAGAPQTPAPTTPVPKPPDQPYLTDAHVLDLLHDFMMARMAGDQARVAGMLTPDVPPAGIRFTKQASRITGYTAEKVVATEPDTFPFRLRVAFSGSQPGGEVAAEEIRFTAKGGLKISAYSVLPKESLAVSVGKDGNLYLSRGQDTATVASLASLPNTFKPWGAGAGVEFGVGKDGWAVAAPTLTGSHVVWGTRGLHPLVGISQINWGAAPSVTPLDLAFEAGFVDAAWAPGGARHLALVVAQPSGAVTLQIWDVPAKDRFGPDLQKALGTVDYTVRNVRWLGGGTIVAFEVQQGGGVSGPWQYNVTNRTLTPP